MLKVAVAISNTIHDGDDGEDDIVEGSLSLSSIKSPFTKNTSLASSSVKSPVTIEGSLALSSNKSQVMTTPKSTTPKPCSFS